jgi:hypothetical protein
VVVDGLRIVGVEVVAQRDAPLKGAVVDLDVLVAAALDRRAAPVPGDDEDTVDDGELDLGGVHTGQLDDDVDGGRVLRPVGIDPRPEAGALGRDAMMAEVGEELLHLGLEPVEVSAVSHATIVAVGRILKAAGAAVGLLLYVWVAAVRLAPGIRARKAARRAARRL